MLEAEDFESEILEVELIEAEEVESDVVVIIAVVVEVGLGVPSVVVVGGLCTDGDVVEVLMVEVVASLLCAATPTAMLPGVT